MITLLLIDIQKDFHPGGSLAIPSALDDAARTASFITQHASQIQRIVVTLDTHPRWHIAHPTFWEAAPTSSSSDGGGGSDDTVKDEEEDHNNRRTPPRQHPAPFTIISSQDIRTKKWIPVPKRQDDSDNEYPIPNISLPSSSESNTKKEEEEEEEETQLLLSKMDPLTAYCIKYTTHLESSKDNHRKFALTIWPEHCIIGSIGHEVVEEVAIAISNWVQDDTDTTNTTKKDQGTTTTTPHTKKREVEYVRKGMNPYTEMYSAICAEVPVDTSTSFNHNLIDSLLSTPENTLVICGQALSHCVNYTVRDIVSQWTSTTRSTTTVPSTNGKITLLKDCMSSVPGFEEAGEKFLQDMMEVGVNVTASDLFVP